MANLKNGWRACNEFIIRNIFPAGWFILLTGMFWLDRSGTYHRLFYWFLALPCMLVLISDFKIYRYLLRQPIFLSVSIFFVYMLVTLLWSNTDKDPGGMVKMSFLILVFILSAAIFYSNSKQRFEGILYMAASLAVVSAACSLVYHNYTMYYYDAQARLPGYFLLDNPLLTAHVYGAFAVYWMAQLFLTEGSKKLPVISIFIIGILLIQTGSRTPFIGIGLALLWLFFMQNKKKESIIGAFIIIICVLAQYKIATSFGTWAGYSLRPELWAEIVRQISESLWFGHGFKAPVILQVSGYEFYDPHNIGLAVMYEGGIVGLILWVLMYICVLRFSWRLRNNKLVVIASAWLIFGIGAGLTEGRSFMSLPKEHWFLIWIPLAILFAASALQGKREKMPPENAGAKVSEES